MRRTLIVAVSLLLFLGVSLTAAEIHEAAKAGDVETLQSILAENPDQINAADAAGSLPLHLAALGGQLEAVKLLVAAGAAVSAGDGDNTTPLICAAMRGHMDIVTFLLDNGASIDERDNFGNTPYLASAGGGNIELMEYFIGKGFDINAQDSRGYSALHMAAFQGRVGVIQRLVDLGADLGIRDNDSMSVLCGAAYAGQRDAAELLIELGADVNETPNRHGHMPLFAAIWFNKADVSKLLIEKGANLNYLGAQGETALHLAATRGNQEIAQLLLDAGIDVNVIDNSGGTPLSQAAWEQTEMVRWLIDHGAEVNAMTDTSRAPIVSATYGGNTETVRTLISSGATVNCSRRGDEIPLQIAASRGNEELATVLLDAGADVDVVDSHCGRTALHWSAIRGQSGLAKNLISHGADVESRDLAGNSAFYYAARYGNRSVADFLRAKGAETAGIDEHYGRPLLLGEARGEKEAAIWHLGHSGWGIKTQNNFLIFDYYEEDAKPDQPGLANGCIDPAEIKGLNVTVFSSHEHGDHYDTTIFGWREHIPDITYVLGHQPEDRSGYAYIPPRTDQVIGDLHVWTIASTDGGVGYLVEVDGLIIFHAGDHANGEVGLHAAYTDEIDYLTSLGKEIDLAFLPITGCSLGTPESVKEGVYHSLEKLTPRVFIPQHGGNAAYRYREFAEDAREDGFTLQIPCVENGGDCVLYQNGTIM